MVSEFTLEGDLAQVALPKVLLAVEARRGSGILTVQGEDDIVAVSFLDGAIVSADALNQTVEAGLGRVLEKQGLVRPGDFQAVYQEYEGGSTGSFGDRLVEKGLIDRSQLLDALRFQTLRLMLKVLTWREGDYKFYSGDEVSYEEGFRPIDVAELLARAVERLGESVGLIGELPDVSTVYRQVPPRSAVQVLSQDGDGGVGIWITPQQSELLRGVDGARTGEQIASAQGVDPFALRFGLYMLLQFDLIEPLKRSADATGASPFQRAAPAALKRGKTAGSLPDLDDLSLELGFDDGASGALPTVGGDGADSQSGAGGLALRGRPGPSEGDSESPTESDGREGLDATGAASEPVDPLKEEIFSPPDPLEIEALRQQEEAARSAAIPTAWSLQLMRWVGPVLGLALLVTLALQASDRPSLLPMPYPWQEASRTSFEQGVRQSAYARLDRAGRVFFLDEAHYPDSLDDLIERELLAEGDLRDPAGYDVDYTTDALSYRVRLVDGGTSIAGFGTREAITGDFLIDSGFLGTAARARAPLVLLD